jgi:DNA polymerase delta subunit 1
MVVFQAIAWEGKDSDGEAYIIKIFGRTEDGKSVCLSTKFRPYFFVKSREGSQKFIKEPVVHAASVKGKELWGFTNNQECVFVKLDFHTLKAMKEHERVLKRSYQIYESNIDPVLRFMHRTNISSTGWLDSGPECERAYISTCDIDLWCNNWKSLTPVARDDIAPLRIMSFDIEAYSHDGGFPDPEHHENVVFQIGMTTKVYGQEGWFDRKCLCLKQTDAEDCESFEKEEDLLEAFAKYLVKTDPDIITGYNIFGFDLEFLMKRMRILPVTPTTCFWTRLRDRSVQLVEKTLSSNALGSNQLKMVPMAGRYVFDLFQDIKREHKLESYSLNAVSKEFLKDQKNDMPVREIFRRYKDGDPKELGEVAEYCIKDTELPHALMKKLFTIENLTEMAKATWVPLSFLSERGQQIKVFSQLSRKARELGFMIPVMKVNGNDDKYQGATVLEAQTGAYYAPITALDFASLYPSIMCAHNLCYSTMVMEPKYDNLPGVTYEQFGQFRFAQNVPSLLPAILTELKQFRKKAKKLMAQSEGTPMYGVYNGQQLAYKISMNSVYGFTGASKGMLPLVAIASTVTMRGRQMIEETKNYVEANFPGAKVRYGDSVMPETPVLVRRKGIVSVEKIENLAQEWMCYPGFLKDGTNKEQSELENIEAWTHDGWKPIRRVIRHKCQKKIWRVLTHTGLVDVTEDHSLLDTNLNQVKPENLMLGQQVFHSFPDTTQIQCEYTDEELFVFGMFVGDGSCGLYDCPSGKKATWAINNQSAEILERCREVLETMYPELKFIIMDTLASSGVYKLSPRGKVRSLTEKWRTICYDGNAKKVPDFAIGRKGFLEGLWASDGCRRDNEVGGCLRIDTKNQVTAQWYYIYLRSLGYKVSLNTRSDKPNVFRLTFTKSSFRKNEKSIKKVSVLHDSWDGYVYDLETEAGTFQGGIGQMVVKNTDSVMVEFDVGDRTGQEAIDYSWQLGEEAAEQCTKLFKAPNDLELEKIYCPYFLYSKKRYAAKMYEGASDKQGRPILKEDGTRLVVFKKIDVKGLQVVRRDNCPYVREVCKDILATILETSDPLPSIEKARTAAKNLKAGLVPMEKLTMSKQLGADYKSKSLAHVAVVQKMRERVPGSEPQQGDRVPFVIVQGPKNAKMFERAEDPQYVREYKLKLDFDYYFENQLKNPVCDLLEPLVGDTKVIFEKPTKKISDFFKPV